MNVSQNGFAIMHFYEKCVLFAYPDPVSPMARRIQKDGLWYKALASQERMESLCEKYSELSGSPFTIGWGDTGPHVTPGLSWTQEQADEAYANRLNREFEPGVERVLTREAEQHEFDAMVSLAYNIGVKGFSGSTVLRKFNAGDKEGAKDAFMSWVKAGGVDNLGLYRRRTTESLYFGGEHSVEEAIAQGQALKELP